MLAFRAVLRLAPWEFRVRFGHEMRCDFADGLVDARRTGRACAIRHAWAECTNLLAALSSLWWGRTNRPLAAAVTATLVVMLTPIIPTPVRAQARPDFSGTWVLNRQASQLAPEVSAVRGGIVQIDHREPDFRFSRTFTIAGLPPQSTSYAIRTDGRPQQGQGPRGNPNLSTLRWQGASLVLSTQTTLPAGEATNIVRYDLLERGRILRAAEQLRSPQSNHDNIWIFDRQVTGGA